MIDDSVAMLDGYSMGNSIACPALRALEEWPKVPVVLPVLLFFVFFLP
jgi:hypothetical protein